MIDFYQACMCIICYFNIASFDQPSAFFLKKVELLVNGLLSKKEPKY